MAIGPADGGGYVGPLDDQSSTSQFNAISFMMKQLLSRIATCTEVKVVGVTNNGGVAPVGFVDVQPLVNQVDGAGNAVPHGVIYGLPYFRLQGGANAIIIDPKVNDNGIVVFADHDISSVKANKGQANPGSSRRFDMADGIFFGGDLNGTPTQYFQLLPDGGGINILSPGNVNINGVVITPQGEIRAPQEITAKYGGGASVTLTGHTHTQGSDSHGDTEQPTNKPTAGT